MHSGDFSKKEIIDIRNKITNDFAQKSCPNDRMLDIDSEISVFGDEMEKRGEFARDRDRIIYSTAFRRLEHKAQVYSHEKGDHYRTRLTHTLEVMQIARGIARNLGLNEDLTEAIALGHDIGHTPFGHAGEEVLDKIMRGEDDLGGKLKYKLNYGGFKHNFHSLKVLDVLEMKYEKEKGLNLTWQVLEGILKHTRTHKKGKTWDLSRFVKNEDFFKPFEDKDVYHKNNIKELLSKSNEVTTQSHGILESPFLNIDLNRETFNFNNSLTLEGQVVNISDEIAQRQHDLDDGLRDVELRMNELDVLVDTKKIIDTALEEIILEKIVLECSDNKNFYPITFLLYGLDEIIDLLRKTLNLDLLGETGSKEIFNKMLRDILLTDIMWNIFLENYYDYLDKDIRLLLDLKRLIHRSKIEKDDFKWKNRRRNVVSYFIHDISYNTMKNIEDSKCIFYRDNLHYREENLNYLISKKCFTNSSPISRFKHCFNMRNYAMDQCVNFSKTATKFNEKIEKYIENRIINSYNVNRFDGKAKFILRQVFKAYYENPKQMNKNQLDYLSNLINENMDTYYELEFSDNGTKIRDIKFDSEDPEFVLNLKEVSRLINLLKLEVKLEDLNNPNINFLKDPKTNLDFLKEIDGNSDRIDKKSPYLDDEKLNILIFDEILQKINSMDKSSIIKEKNKEKRDKILFIKCLIENHYSYLSIICDHIAGMTDNYAKNEYEKLYLV
ncbi:Deoxyguanosinetriphosphate triphosphohydrolase-like protein [anaerobic digester metagenome]